MNDSGIAFIKELEGCELQAYKDSAGVYTVGYGHTGKNISSCTIITPAEAESYLKSDLRAAEFSVVSHIKVSYCSSMYTALVAFVFNVGCAAFENSTMLRLINAGKFFEAAKEFDRWVYVKMDGHFVKSKGLINRRAKERALFESSFVTVRKPWYKRMFS